MRSIEQIDRYAYAARCCAIVAISMTIVATSCGRDEVATSASGALATPATVKASPFSGAVQPGVAAADDVLSIESNTQAHAGQLAIGAGNFWEEEYTPPGEAPRRGLTAGLWLTYRDDPAQNRQLRVYPGQEIVVPGYRLSILAVETTVVRLLVRREP